jgi:excisionase family DNA binding protein
MTIKEILDSGLATISVREAASIIGCDPRTISREIESGNIDYITAGNRYRIPVVPLLKKLGIEFGGESIGF